MVPVVLVPKNFFGAQECSGLTGLNFLLTHFLYPKHLSSKTCKYNKSQMWEFWVFIGEEAFCAEETTLLN